MSRTRTRTGFRTLRTRELPVFAATVHELEHATGAKHLHFACPDDHRVFAVIIPTVPTDETGAPHVLEHCVITGGSKRYPDLRSRGTVLSTGGGAWTGWEYTWYFSGARSDADLLGQLDIHLDFLFEPLLDEETFWKEGHHLEFEVPDDPTTPLRYRGVIYNEQKGILAHPIYVGWTELCRGLFGRTHPYALEHGGTPRTVPDLTWDALRAFHARHYHPANAHIITWGDVPLDDVLETIDVALSRVPERAFEPTPFPRPARREAPVRHTGRLPVGDPSGRGMVLVGWVAADATDAYDALRYEVASELLTGSGAAPLHEALASAGLGTVADTYDRYGVRLRDMVFACGIQDADPAVADDVEALVLSTLERVARDGIDPELVDAAVTKVELDRRTLARPGGGEGDPRSMFIRFMNTAWVCGADPVEAVSGEAASARLERERSSGRPIEDFILERLVGNPHRALAVLDPDPDADVRLEDEERAKLAAIELTEERRDGTIADARRLRAYLARRAEAPELPGFEAIARAASAPASEPVSSEAAGVPVEAYATRTNGITYVDLFADLGELPDDLWDHLTVFCRAVARGDLRAEVLVPVDGSGRSHRRLLRIGGRALDDRQDGLVATIVARLLEPVAPDDVRAASAGALAQAEHDLFIRTTEYLKRLAGSHVRRSWALRDRLDGSAQLAMLRSGAASTASVEAIRDHVARRGRLEVFVASSGTGVPPALERALERLPDGGSRGRSFDDLLPPDAVRNEARTWGTPAAFNCEVMAVPGREHPDAAAIAAAASLCSRWNRDEVSRRGTAYSAACDASSDPGSFVHWSIRDPNIARTYGAFAEGIRRLRSEPIGDGELGLARAEAFILGDMPQAPAVKARSAFLDARSGVTAGSRRRYRETVECLDASDVRRAADEHLRGPGARATIASGELVSDAGGFDAVRPT